MKGPWNLRVVTGLPELLLLPNRLERLAGLRCRNRRLGDALGCVVSGSVVASGKAQQIAGMSLGGGSACSEHAHELGNPFVSGDLCEM